MRPKTLYNNDFIILYGNFFLCDLFSLKTKQKISLLMLIASMFFGSHV